MKTSLFILTLPALATASYGQFWTLPPSSSMDDVAVQDIGSNSGADAWNATDGLAAYAASSDGNSYRFQIGSSDNPLGLTWQSTPSVDAIAAKNSVNANGGTVRAIFVGETAGWLNAFGYTY